MTTQKLIVIIIIIIITSCQKITEPEKTEWLDSHVYIASWLYNREIAICFNFDDNSLTHEEVGFILDNFGFKASFFVNPGYSSWHEEMTGVYQTLIQSGHEVGNHSWTHKDLTTLELEELIFEVNRPIKSLQEDLSIYPLSFVQPFDETNELVDQVIFENHLFSRVSSHYSLERRVRIGLGANITLAHLDARYDLALEKNAWLIITAHNLNTEGSTSLTISPQFLQQVCEYIKDKKQLNRIWMGSLSQIAHYEYLREEISVTTSVDKNTLLLSFDGYDAEKYNRVPASPITVIIEKPAVFKGIEADPLLEYYTTKEEIIITVDLKNSTEYIVVLKE